MITKWKSMCDSMRSKDRMDVHEEPGLFDAETVCDILIGFVAVVFIALAIFGIEHVATTLWRISQ